MKHFMMSFLFVAAALIARAQANNPTFFTYKQKQFSDSLKILFPDLQKSNKAMATQFNTPVFPLSNEGVLNGVNNLGKLYKMKVDNMPCLRPKETNTAMPNAFKRELLTAPPKEK